MSTALLLEADYFTDKTLPEMVETPIKCEECHGTGQLEREMRIHGFGFVDLKVECSKCNGEGEIVIALCSYCGKSEFDCKCEGEY